MEREARQMPKAKLRAASRVQNEPDVPPARPPQPLDIRQGGFEPAGVLGTPQWIPSKQITQAALMSSSGESSKPAIGSSSPSLGLQSLLSQSTVTTPGTFNRSQRPLGISSTRSFGPAALSSSILTQQSTSSLPTVSRFAQRPADTTPHATKHPTNTTIPREATPASNPTKLFKLFVHPSQLLAANSPSGASSSSSNTAGSTASTPDGKKSGRTCTVCGRESCKGRGGYKYCPYPCRDCGGPGTICQGRDVKAGKKLCTVAAQRLLEQRRRANGPDSSAGEGCNHEGSAGGRCQDQA